MRAPAQGRHGEILTALALAFLADLQRRFDPRREDLPRAGASAMSPDFVEFLTLPVYERLP